MKKIRLDISHKGAVANIVLDDGNGNVLDNIMMLELLNVLNNFKTDKNIKLITFKGEGKHFSFGASVAEHTKKLAPTMLKTFHEIFYSIIELEIPTMAIISGQCLGGGFELALICNFMFADKTAVLSVPEIILGVFPPPASIILPLKIGNARAEDILITGKTINAEEGHNIGLLNEIFEDNECLMAGVEDWIVKYILPKSASSLKYAVKTSRKIFNTMLKKELPVLENIYVDQLMQTKDANEGIHSFLEKRKPNWENC
jgi:cyclohexa-1,5-dienecarbonyl-CoA hydratase